jgi:purine-binding chemotaxis protein CheW
MPLLLLFRVGALDYGLEIEAIQEVADQPPHYPVPAACPPLLGAVNLHGQVLPVIDLPALLGVKADALDQRLVVLADPHPLALAVSMVGRIVPFDREELAAAGASAPAAAGTLAIDDRPVNLLDADAVIERLEFIFAT